MAKKTFLLEKTNKGFTLIELLIVIVIIAILSIVVVLTLSPNEMLRQARDATRLSDMDTMNRALGLYVTDMATQGTSLNLGNASTVYISLIDNISSTCGSLGLPALPAGYIYHCGSATSSRNTDGNGWLPVSLKNISSGSPLGSLPIDPQNSSSSNLYYTYVTNESQYELTSLLESSKYKTVYGQNPQLPTYPEVLAQGSNLALNPLFNPSGLVGYWPLDEGSGSSTIDQSGNGITGTWTGIPTNGSYYVGGKVGSGAGNFDGSSTEIFITGAPSGSTNNITVTAWVEKTVGNAGTVIRCGSTYFLDFENGATLLRFSVNGQWYVNNSFTNNGQWHMVAGIYNGSTSKRYLDGTLLGQTSYSGTVPSCANPTIGYAGAGTSYFSGLIDDVRIYNRALSPAEVSALYNAEK